MLKLKMRHIEIITFLFVILSFIILALFLPLYDTINSFHNIILDDYKLTWYDGRSPLNFYLIKNIINGNSITFNKGQLLGNMKVEEYYDFFECNGKFYPIFNFIPDYIYAAILYPFSQVSDIQLFKEIIIINTIFFAIILFIFYHIQKILGLNVKYSLMSTFVAGIATSILIYSRYLFIDIIIMNLTFILLIYIFLKKPTNSLKFNIIIVLLFSLYLVLLNYFYIIIISFIILSYFFIKYNLIQFKFLLITILIAILFSIYFQFFYPNSTCNFYREDIPGGINYFEIGKISVFTVFSKYINALDYNIFGYHNVSSIWKLYRQFGHVYAFEQPKGNAIFLSFYGLFGSLFGPRGFIFNSPYLILSIFGILAYKNKKGKNILLASIILIILMYGVLNLMWQGGVTPRYIKYYNIVVLFLTFFSFYYIQEAKNKILRLIFIGLIILSILNVSSLAIRADWTYEHDANLVSYDLVLWPWYPPTSQGNDINLYLTELGESVEWNFNEELKGCTSYGTLEGIITPLCSCEYDTYAERNINIPWNKIRINITACNKNSKDILGKFYFDDKEKDLLIESNSCKQESIIIENSSGNHNLILKSGKYGECTNEFVIWKLITIEKV
jgi:hypothetical protein